MPHVSRVYPIQTLVLDELNEKLIQKFIDMMPATNPFLLNGRHVLIVAHDKIIDLITMLGMNGFDTGVFGVSSRIRLSDVDQIDCAHCAKCL